MKLKPAILALAAASICLHNTSAQSILGAGDIVITGMHTNGSNDSMNFVSLVDIAAGTRIYFTDNGWTGSAFRGSSSTDYDGSEGFGYLDVTGVISAGSVINSLSDPSDGTWKSISNNGTISSSTTFLNFAQTGDQVYAFQSTASLPTTGNPLSATGSMNHLSAIATTSSWGNATSSNNGNLPVSYASGTTYNSSALQAGSTYFNLVVAGNTGSTKSEWLTALATGANWSTNSSTTSALPAISFQIEGQDYSWSSGSGTLQRGISGNLGEVFSNSDSSTIAFNGVAGAVTIAGIGGVKVGNVAFSQNSGEYFIGGGNLDIAGDAGLVTTNNGLVATIDSQMVQTTGLTKSGAGMLILSGSNTYTGTTSVNEGKLIVTGAIHTSSSVTVSNGATLAGESSDAGVTNGKVTAITLNGGAGTGGILAPGNGTAGDLGTLYGTSLAWNGATDTAFSQILFDLGSSNASDKLVLSGAMTKGTGSIFEWDFGDTGFLDNTYTLVTAAAGFGTFLASDFTYKGSSLASGLDGAFSIDGNDLKFTTWTAIPEPTSALAGLLIAAGLLRRRRVA